MIKNLFTGPYSACQPRQFSIFVTIIEKLMYCFLFFLPCGFALAEIVQKLWVYQTTYGLPFNLVFFVGICIILCICCFCAAWRYKRDVENSFSVHVTVFAICLGAFLIRLLFCFLLNGKPENDFLSLYNYAFDPVGCGPSLAAVPYYGIYAIIVRWNMSLWNSTAPMVAMIFQAFVTSFIPALLFYAVKKFTNSNYASFLASLFYAFFPSMILFTVCLAGENISQFFMAACFLFFIYAWAAERKQKYKKFWTFTILACFCAALVNLFKPISLIIILVILVEELLYRIIPGIRHAIKTHDIKLGSRSIIVTLCILFLLKGFEYGTLTVSGKIIEQHTGIETGEIYYGADTFAQIAYFGLAKEGNGVWNQEVLDKRDAILKNSASVEEANSIMLNLLAEQIKESPKDFLSLLHQKLLISWSDEWAYGYYASVPNDGQTSVNSTPSGYFALTVLPRLYIGILYACCLVEFIIRIICPPPFWRREQRLITLFWGAFTCVFLILEAHARYKSTFMPLLCVMASLGIFDISNLSIKLVKKFLRNKSSSNLSLQIDRDSTQSVQG